MSSTGVWTAWAFVRRWLWLFIIATLLTAATSYVVSVRLPQTYAAWTRLQVTPGQADQGLVSYDSLLAAERLTRTYSELVKTRPVVEAALGAGGFALPYERASTLVQATPIRDTQLIQIGVRANDPEFAAQFTNLLAEALVRHTEVRQSRRFAASKESMAQQVEQLAASVTERTRRLALLTSQPPGPARDSELASLQIDLAQFQQRHAAVLERYEGVRLSEAQSSDLLTVVDPAVPPPAADEPRLLLNVLMGAFAGLVLAIGAAMLIEYLDDRLTSPERLRQIAGLDVLAALAVLPHDPRTTIRQIATAPTAPPDDESRRNGHGDIVEVFRLLSASLRCNDEGSVHTLAATSANVGDGKTTTAVSLAVVTAQSGQKVVLVDADLRSPSLHEVFGVSNQTGLTSLMLDEHMELSKGLMPTSVPGLWLLSSGPLPPAPSQLLASAQLRRRLSELGAQFDLVILDCPPALVASDSALVTRLADGTILVVDAQHTHRQDAVRAVAVLESAGAHILGSVLNRVRPGEALPYGYRAQRHHVAATPASPPAGDSQHRWRGLAHLVRLPRVLGRNGFLGRLRRSGRLRVLSQLIVLVVLLTLLTVWRFPVPPQEAVSNQEERSPGAGQATTAAATAPPATPSPQQIPATVTGSANTGGEGAPSAFAAVALPAPTDRPEPTPSAPQRVLHATDASTLSAAPPSNGLVAPLRSILDERFADVKAGWPNNSESTAWFDNGVYRLSARQPAQFVAVGVPIPGPIGDVLVTARFRKVGGPRGGGYGLVVRDQGPGPRDGVNQKGRYYVLEVGDRGEIGIWRREDDRWIDIVPWTPSESVRPDDAENQLTVRAVGERLTFVVNGDIVARDVESTLSGGAVGVFVGGDFNDVVLEHIVVQAPI